MCQRLSSVLVHIPIHLRRRADLPLPATWTECRCVAAIVQHEPARERARDLGLDDSAFSSEIARTLVSDALNGKSVTDAIHRHDGRLLPWRTALWLSSQEPNDGTANETHAVIAVEAWAREYGAAALGEQFEWAAKQVRLGELTPRDRDELESLLTLAGIPRRGAVA